MMTNNKHMCDSTIGVVAPVGELFDPTTRSARRNYQRSHALRSHRKPAWLYGTANALEWFKPHSRENSPMVNRIEQAGSNPDDAIRDAILRHLHAIHQQAKSPGKAAIGIRDLRAALKATRGFKQQEVGSNLDYLVQKGWVTEVKIERYFTTPKGTRQNSEQVKYKISNIGLDKLQRASLYQKTPLTTGINITNVHGVTVVGDGNVVNTNFTDLSRVLNELKSEVQANTTINDEKKLAVVADIDTIQSQLQSPKPNKSVIGMLWGGIEKIVTAAGLVDVATKAGAFIGPLLS
jgi:hypothetical protein